ncbi:MAG: twin-arginine translocation signal domain-containing protein, partial [Devosiaceae bacterium]
MSSTSKGGLSRRAFMQSTAVGAAALGLGTGFGAGSAKAMGVPASINTIIPGSTLRWIDSGDQKAVFYRQFFADYAQARGIDIVYDPLPWNEIAPVVPLGVRNDSAHDVFALPQNVNPADAVAQDWVQPYDDFIPNFDEWKAGFPDGAFLPGI